MLKLHISLLLPYLMLPSLHCSTDPNGYIAYCPCMGRFGNQADYFLGALGFAKGLNRTLMLPAWVEYRNGEPRSIQVPFDTYFKIEPLKNCHRVILMEDFMKNIAPKLWPPEKRISFCYMPRGSTQSCNAKQGNPFGPFWDHYDIDFIDSEFYGPLHINVYNTDMIERWNEKYPANLYPVLAFTGAPATFPVQEENKVLHKYLVWNDAVDREAQDFIKNALPKGSFISIHLRNGIDWVHACERIRSTPDLFAAPQCVGYGGGKATHDMCLPSTDLVVKQIKRVARGMSDLVGVVVASDSDYMTSELIKAFSRTDIKIVKSNGSTPHIDLAIMGRANQFIGNCISSFSAFAVRERTVRGLPSHFWAYPPQRQKGETNNGHDEL